MKHIPIIMFALLSIYMPLTANAARISTTSCAPGATAVDILDSSLSSTSSKPTISGSAPGAQSIRLVIKKEGSTKTIFKSKVVKVKNCEWKVKVNKKLSDGKYTITVTQSKGIGPRVTTDTLTIGQEVTNISTGRLIVASVPLLSGGTTQPGTTVPISYLQITNIGSEEVFLEGFWVKQNGSAPHQSIIGFSSADDTGTLRKSSGGTEGSLMFSSEGFGFVPADVTFAPGQMRLFTLKATISSNTQLSAGKQLMLDVASIKTNGSTQGLFPIRGTTWSITY